MTSTSIAERVQRAPGAWSVAVAGAVALGAAVGIGRFAFTPLLPMMLDDGVVDLASGSWLATANYLGYLAGALLCMAQPWIARRARRRSPTSASLVRAGLLATVLLTLGMAAPAPLLWPLLRFLAGVASAVVFVFTSGWCLARLAALGRPTLGGAIYAGPGAGIAISGLAAGGMVAGHWSAAAGWAAFGLLACVLSAIVWPILRGADEIRPGAAIGLGRTRATAGTVELTLFTVAYGLAGFGYIITATFLPVIARATLPGSVWLDLFWPIFGIGVMAGAGLSVLVPARIDRRPLLAGCYLVQALGIAASLSVPSLAGFAAGSLMVGLPLTAISFFAMQEARRLRPAAAASFMGLLTAVFGIGQIAGPPFTALVIARSASPAEGFALALASAAASLLFGGVLYLWMLRAHPARGAE